MLKNKIFAGVLAVMMMAPFSTGLLSFAAEENTLADYTFEELLAMEESELFALTDGWTLSESASSVWEAAAAGYPTRYYVTDEGASMEHWTLENEILKIPEDTESLLVATLATEHDDEGEPLAYYHVCGLYDTVEQNGYQGYTAEDVYCTAYLMLYAAQLQPTLLSDEPWRAYIENLIDEATVIEESNPEDTSYFDSLLAMEKEELCALVDEKENLLYNGEYLYDDAESLYEKRSHILLTINPEDLAEMGITEPENMEEFEALWDALQLPGAVVDYLEYYDIVYGEGMIEYDVFRISLTGETYQGYEAKEVAITLCMMLNANPLVYYAVVEPIARDDETTAPAETTVPVETTTEAAAETTTETIAETTTAIETAETTASAESTTAGTTTTGTASGGTSSPKTGDSSAAAVLAGCAAALAGCLLCRKRR